MVLCRYARQLLRGETLLRDRQAHIVLGWLLWAAGHFILDSKARCDAISHAVVAALDMDLCMLGDIQMR